MARTAEEYRELLLALLPSGDIWPREPGTVLAELCLALGEELARVDEQLELLVEETDPRTAFYLLAEWESVCGLPGECDYSGSTLAERRAALHAKLTAQGSQTPASFVELAAALGYEVTLTEHSPALAGVACAGDPCQGEEWAHAFQINAPETTVFDSVAGAAQAGDRVRTWGNEKLECAIEAKKPAHTACIFSYGA